MKVHDSAQKGFSSASEAYAQGRPDYPVEVVSWLKEIVGIGPRTRVVDVGSGTGKFLPYLKACGAQPVALEPVKAMRERLMEAHPDVMVLDSTADRIPVEDSSLDAIVSAQAFHWFATEETVAEFFRALRPGGVLSLIWNVRDDSVPWVAALTDILAPYAGDTPGYKSGVWKRVLPTTGLEQITERRDPYPHTGPAEDVILKRSLSISYVAAQPEKVRGDIEEKIRRLIAETPELSGKQQVIFPYETYMVAFRKVQ